MKHRTAFGMLLFVLVIFGALFYENAIGYYRYLELCESEAGPRVHHKLRRNVIWITGQSVHRALPRGYVRFARVEVDGKWFDAHYVAGAYLDSASYELVPADQNMPAIYELQSFYMPLDGYPRTWRGGYNIVEISTQKIMGGWVEFVYDVTSRGLLDNNSRQRCQSSALFFREENFAGYFADR